MWKILDYLNTKMRLLNQAIHRLSARWRVLPDFVIIGAQRAGTTSLHKYLVEHPQVEWAYKKEVHYFDTHFSQGLDWYRAHFPTRFHIARNKRKGRKLVVGEATPYYLFHPLAAQRLKELMPNAKLIVILRNPIDRAYSQYQQSHLGGRDPLSFEEAIEKEAERLKGQAEKIAAEKQDMNETHKNQSYQARGRYAEQLKHWFTLFPREQFLILKAEEMYEKPREVMERVWKFIGVSPDAVDQTSYKAHNTGKYTDMNPKTRKKLARYFQPYNQELYELLGENYNWEATEQP